ncbi:hypothetical protein ACOME3_003318 [Neoechinorhynchus agilis]
MENEVDLSNMEHLLPIYYRRLFPSYIYCKWLSGGEQPALSKTFSRREFSFTLDNDVYVRYLSYSNHIEFEKDLVSKCPRKIDIGAVFNVKPKDHNCVRAEAFKPTEKELVIDLDISDYDDVRSCCSGANVCTKCWPLITVAVKIIDKVLRDDFGYQHLLWVFSGRRGVHCWICDANARILNNQQRSALMDYLTVTKATSEGMSQRVQLRYPIHPSIERAIDLIERMFENYACIEQDFLGTNERVRDVFSKMLPNDVICLIESAWKELSLEPGSQISLKRWRSIVEICMADADYSTGNIVINIFLKRLLFPTGYPFYLVSDSQ